MKMHPIYRSLLALSVLVPVLAGGASCSSSDSAGGGGNNDGGTGGVAGTGGSAGDSGTADSAISTDSGTADAGSAGSGGGSTDAAAPTDCAQIGSKECFANDGCSTERRCEMVATSTQLSCCVVGTRGSKTAGQVCANENDCESAVCVAGGGPSVCSKTCDTADDCPAGMKKCISIGFGAWCMPTN